MPATLWCGDLIWFDFCYLSPTQRYIWSFFLIQCHTFPSLQTLQKSNYVFYSKCDKGNWTIKCVISVQSWLQRSERRNVYRNYRFVLCSLQYSEPVLCTLEEAVDLSVYLFSSHMAEYSSGLHVYKCFYVLTKSSQTLRIIYSHSPYYTMSYR